jgi:hypothetical protein
MRYISGTKLDERIIRCDLDLGYKEGRQFGRGRSGGQVRDEHRQDYDPGRGGWGAQAAKAEAERRREVEERYADAGTQPVAGGGGDWKAQNMAVDTSKKRERSPDDAVDGPAVRSRSHRSVPVWESELSLRLHAQKWRKVKYGSTTTTSMQGSSVCAVLKLLINETCTDETLLSCPLEERCEMPSSNQTVRVCLGGEVDDVPSVFRSSLVTERDEYGNPRS